MGVGLPGSESSHASERFRGLPFCAALVLVFPSDEPGLCRSFGGSSPPPFNSTHWIRYVFRICEKTCTTSPAGLTCTIRIAPSALSSSLSSPLPSLERPCSFEPEYRDKVWSTSKSLRRPFGISATLAAVADAPEILDTVGNSCSPARSPKGSNNIGQFLLSHVRGIARVCCERDEILTSFWPTDEQE